MGKTCGGISLLTPTKYSKKTENSESEGWHKCLGIKLQYKMTVHTSLRFRLSQMEGCISA